MKRVKLNGSPAEVEAAFYDALNRADVAAVMAVWADDDDIVCIHPGGPRLHGHAAIQASWQAILQQGGLPVRPAQLYEAHNLMSAVHTVVEGSTAAGGGFAAAGASGLTVAETRSGAAAGAAVAAGAAHGASTATGTAAAAAVGAPQGEAAHLLATNVYLKTPQGWRMVLHHVSVAAGPAPSAVPASAQLH